MKTSYTIKDVKSELSKDHPKLVSKMGKLIIPKDIGVHKYNKIDVQPFLVKHSLINETLTEQFDRLDIGYSMINTRLSRVYSKHTRSEKRVFTESYNIIKINFNRYSKFSDSELYVKVLQQENKKSTKVSILISSERSSSDWRSKSANLVVNIDQNEPNTFKVYESDEGEIDLGKIISVVKYHYEQYDHHGKLFTKSAKMAGLLFPVYARKCIDVIKDIFDKDIELGARNSINFVHNKSVFNFNEVLQVGGEDYESGSSMHANIRLSPDHSFGYSYRDMNLNLTNLEYNISDDLKNDLRIFKQSCEILKLYSNIKNEIKK